MNPLLSLLINPDDAGAFDALRRQLARAGAQPQGQAPPCAATAPASPDPFLPALCEANVRRGRDNYIENWSGFGPCHGSDTEREILATLNAPLTAPVEVIRPVNYCGEQAYRLPSGWVVEVFWDCGDWDYLDSVTAPDGRRWDFEALPQAVRHWQGDPALWPPCEGGHVPRDAAWPRGTPAPDPVFNVLEMTRQAITELLHLSSARVAASVGLTTRMTADKTRLDKAALPASKEDDPCP
jgi:hypothetical protein